MAKIDEFLAHEQEPDYFEKLLEKQLAGVGEAKKPRDEDPGPAEYGLSPRSTQQDDGQDHLQAQAPQCRAPGKAAAVVAQQPGDQEQDEDPEQGDEVVEHGGLRG